MFHSSRTPCPGIDLWKVRAMNLKTIKNQRGGCLLFLSGGRDDHKSSNQFWPIPCFQGGRWGFRLPGVGGWVHWERLWQLVSPQRLQVLHGGPQQRRGPQVLSLRTCLWGWLVVLQVVIFRNLIPLTLFSLSQLLRVQPERRVLPGGGGQRLLQGDRLGALAGRLLPQVRHDDGPPQGDPKPLALLTNSSSSGSLAVSQGGWWELPLGRFHRQCFPSLLELESSCAGQWYFERGYSSPQPSHIPSPPYSPPPPEVLILNMYYLFVEYDDNNKLNGEMSSWNHVELCCKSDIHTLWLYLCVQRYLTCEW